LQKGGEWDLRRPGKSSSRPPFPKGDDAIVDQVQADPVFKNRSI
jgi:hypothetical protein